MEEAQPTFCSLLWSHLFSSPWEDVKPCCRFVKDPETPTSLTLDKALQSEYWRKLRRSSVAGDRIEGCRRCYEEEAIGKKSLRQIYNGISFLGPASADESQVSLRWVEISFSNKCNLACRMCDSRYSSRWLQDEIEVYGDALYKVKKSNADWRQIKDLEKMRLIKITGGEPLIDPEHKFFLKAIVDKGTASQIMLDYSTNVTVLPQKEVRELWKKFRAVELTLSIDSSVPSELHYLRYPADGSKILRNAQILVELLEEIPRLELVLRPTVTLFNVLSIAALLEWWKGLKQNSCDPKRLKENVTHLTYPDHLRPWNLSDRQKAVVLKNLEEEKNNASPEIQKTIDGLKQLVIQPTTQKLRDKFLSETVKIDSIRKQDFKKIFTHL